MRKIFFMLAVPFAAGLIFTSCNSETKPAGESMTAVAEKKPTGPGNKDVYEVINSGNWSKLDSLIGKDGIDHSQNGDIAGIDSIKAMLMQIKSAFPDIHIEAVDEAAEGDMLFTRYRYTGTNTGMLNGMPATNKKVSMTGVDVVKLKDGKLHEHWDYSNTAEFFRQLGIDPMAKSAK